MKYTVEKLANVSNIIIYPFFFNGKNDNMRQAAKRANLTKSSMLIAEKSPSRMFNTTIAIKINFTEKSFIFFMVVI